MLSRSVQLVLHYDGAGFSGWQRQPGERTVQGVLEAAAAKLCGESITVVGAGRTDAGVHAPGPAPERDDHGCTVSHAAWREREGGLVFDIPADRFLHHMVRFLVGTMLEIAGGRRDLSVMRELLVQDDNSDVSPPAPAHALFLERVEY